jgi:hypothetical protein
MFQEEVGCCLGVFLIAVKIWVLVVDLRESLLDG